MFMHPLWNENPITISFASTGFVFTKEKRFKETFNPPQNISQYNKLRDVNGRILKRQKSSIEIIADRVSKHIDEIERKENRLKNTNKILRNNLMFCNDTVSSFVDNSNGNRKSIDNFIDIKKEIPQNQEMGTNGQGVPLLEEGGKGEKGDKGDKGEKGKGRVSFVLEGGCDLGRCQTQGRVLGKSRVIVKNNSGNLLASHTASQVLRKNHKKNCLKWDDFERTGSFHCEFARPF